MDRYLGDSSKIEAIRSELPLLIIKWQEQAAEKKAGGQMEGAAAGQLLGHSSSDYDYDHMSVSLSHSVNQLVKDWDFLQMLKISLLRIYYPWFDPKDIDEVSNKIYTDVSFCGKYLERPQKILDLLRNCQTSTAKLIKALHYPAFTANPAELHPYLTTQELSDFIPLVVQNLRSLEDAGDAVINELCNELLSIHRYIIDVDKSVGLYRIYPGSGDLVSYMYSVLLRIALRSCNFWFNRGGPKAAKVFATDLKSLHRKIDPTNSEFLELNLTLLQYSRDYDSVAHFCNYILLDLGNEDLRKDLIYLLQRYGRKGDGYGIFAEIRVVIEEAVFSSRRVQREATSMYPAHKEVNLTAALPPCSDLLARLCLLKTELFLIEELNTQKTPSTDFSGIRVDGIVRRLRAFTEELSILCRQGNSEYLKQNLVFSEELASEIDSFQKSPHSKRIDGPLVIHTLQQLLLKIVFFKAESFLTDLLRSGDTSIANEKDQIQSLVQELKYFKSIATFIVANYSTDEAVIMQIEGVARGATLLSYSFLPDNKKLEKLIHSLPQLLDGAKVVKAKLEEKSQKFPRIIFPKTYELGFIDILGRHISELLKHDPMSITPVKDIEEALLHLQSLKSFLAKVKVTDAELGELKDLRNHVIEVAYKLEYVVGSIELGGHLHQSLWLYDLLQDIRMVDEQVSHFQIVSFAGKVKDSPKIPPPTLSRAITLEVNKMLIDLGDEEKVIVERLTRGSLKRDVVSIVGMPGIGKTTLARKVYNSKNVMYHFSRRAWCTVSQTCSKRELLLEILSYMPLLTDNISQLTEDDLLSKLRRCLLRNKYLIVMDDVWDTAAWNDLENCFPDDSNGSRILITSRLHDVVSEIKPDSIPHSVRLLSDVESWMLLEKRIFKGEGCPGELLEVGKEIARHCQGLPLAIVAIAGLLQRIEKEEDSWKKVSENLSSVIINNPENQCREILELSYKHLPEYLKPCFLYLGFFHVDKDVPVSKLIRFWMSEGFIQETESKSMEEVAEDYLLELINRSLVNLHKERSNGKPRTCRLHDLLWDLCHLKAKEINFLQLVSRHDKPYASFPDFDYGVEYDSKNQLAPIFESYRLSFNLKRPHFIDSTPSGQGVRSLTFFASFDPEPKCPYDISFICQNFKLLRLLDLESIMAISFPVEIGQMVQLRYLAVSGYMQSIPPSISKLWRLETLVVKGFRGKVILPETIWSLESLRHLRVNNHVAFSIQGLDEQLGSSLLLQSLVSFSTPSLSSGEDALNIFKRLPNLRKLRCIFLQSWDSSEDCNGFPILDFLTHLESLKIIYYGRAINSGEFVLPSNLKKLTLSKFCLQGNHLSMIGKLPCLQILKLLGGDFEGREWMMEEEEFKELLFLELDFMNITEWNSSHDHLPSLERLVLRNCKDLEVIPFDFAYIATLKTIEVQWCRQSVVESAEAIHEETNEIEVLITQF